MIGTVKARGRVHSTVKNDKQPKHGRSHLIVTPDAGTPSGGDKAQHKAGRAFGKGRLKPGVGSADKQNAKAQRSRKVNLWAQGKAESYS
jgi:hypothetical protein